MPRVDADGIKTVLDTTLTDTELDAFIATATLVIDDELVGEGLSDDRLTEIERYLAAHYACLKDPRLAQFRDGNTTSTFQGKTGMHLESTYYGQMVVSLDSTGILKSVGQQKPLKIKVFGARDR